MVWNFRICRVLNEHAGLRPVLATEKTESAMRYILLWALGVPASVLILLALFGWI
ncbi:hypothetical protein W911_14450 [Hyphomicrobium nitrativorans NL23]|uniref:Uncharacterized protein n=1 Tax=Hyphomicrobium nitrativorans NL23 TaxID=1029756 RepID=V5SJT2_9HYPH|nr:hypothetical protein W911_14450 [Hyphomicrobium nitrativorans NL23]